LTLHLSFRRVAEGELDRLRWWMAELTRRRDEVIETFENEGTRHEVVHLLETSDGPILVYATEAEDPEQAHAAFLASSLPIDAEHRKVMGEVVGQPVPAELLLDVELPSDG
jgi:Family of unknown function (DUF6176)